MTATMRASRSSMSHILTVPGDKSNLIYCV